PGAAPLVAEGKPPAPPPPPRAVPASRFPHAAGARHDDDPRFAAEGPKQHGGGVGLQGETGEMCAFAPEVLRLLLEIDARKSQAERAFAGRGHRQSRRGKAAGNGQVDVRPGSVDAQTQSRWAGTAVAKNAPRAVGQTRARAGAAAIDADKIRRRHGPPKRHATNI